MPFATDAPKMRDNGWRSLIPLDGKRPVVRGWQRFGLAPPDDAAFAALVRDHAAPGYGTGVVLDGIAHCLDLDVIAAPGDPPARHDAARELVHELRDLAFDVLGFTDWRRIGAAPKEMLFYRSDPPGITQAGGKVELLGGAGSKQFAAYSIHPDTRQPYRWVGSREPLTHRPDDLPYCTPAELRLYREEALARVAAHPFTAMGPQAAPKDAPARRVRRAAPTADHPAGPHQSAALSRFAAEPVRSPSEIAAELLGEAEPGDRHYCMTGCVGALVVAGYGDAEIADALTGAYRALFGREEAAERVRQLRRTPAGMRGAMGQSKGQPILSVAEMDAMLGVGPGWSIYGR